MFTQLNLKHTETIFKAALFGSKGAKTPGKSYTVFSSQLVLISFILFFHLLLPMEGQFFDLNLTNSLWVKEGREQETGVRVRGSLHARNNQMFLSAAWIGNRCLGAALLQMFDAVDQMRLLAHEEFQRHQREKQGQRNRTGKGKHKAICGY